MPATDREKLLKLARRQGGVATRQALKAGIHTQVLSRLVASGELERVGRGQFRLPGSPVSEQHGLALVAAQAPNAVICLISALSFHRLGTQLPFQVWLAVNGRARKPSVEYPPLRVVRFTGEAFSRGIETHRIEGQSVRIYSVAKTLADCFKYRNKIGLDVALEALREAWRARRVKMDDIDRYARICRVERVMTPYLEAMVA